MRRTICRKLQKMAASPNSFEYSQVKIHGSLQVHTIRYIFKINFCKKISEIYEGSIHFSELNMPPHGIQLP